MHPARTKKENDASPVFRDRGQISFPLVGRAMKSWRTRLSVETRGSRAKAAFFCAATAFPTRSFLLR